MMTRCVRPHARAAWPLSLPMIPYMRGNLVRKQSGLADADAIIAVSSTIAADLRARSPQIAAARVEIIPNAVDVAALRGRAAASPPPIEGPYALYLGKLAPNKGTTDLVRVVERSGLDWPVIIAGDGPEREAIAGDAARSASNIRLVGWGTPDIILDKRTGLLSRNFEELAADIRRLRDDTDLRRQLGAGARLHAETHFDATVVLPRIEQLYHELLRHRA
jgi:glycosyltransferase involved in cell wall biosynthesis